MPDLTPDVLAELERLHAAIYAPDEDGEPMRDQEAALRFCEALEPHWPALIAAVGPEVDALRAEVARLREQSGIAAEAAVVEAVRAWRLQARDLRHEIPEWPTARGGHSKARTCGTCAEWSAGRCDRHGAQESDWHCADWRARNGR